MREKTIDFGFEDIPVEEKVGRVRDVFNSVATKYDRMNDAMSFGVHRLWKSMTITRINPQPGETLIDVAGGTGDLARRFLACADKVRARRGGGAARAIICDINHEMLMAGINPQKDKGLDITRVCGNAESLPFPDRCADALTIAFGIRNVTDRQKALSEFYRVLKPGGRLCVLEFSNPPEGALKALYDAYSFSVIPHLGSLIAGDKDSYQYLVESIRQFPTQEQFEERVRAAGFTRTGWQDYSGGIAALHWGWKV